MEQSPSWEANQFAVSQEIPRILWNPKVHYRIRKCQPPVPILSQLSTEWYSNNNLGMECTYVPLPHLFHTATISLNHIALNSFQQSVYFVLHRCLWWTSLPVMCTLCRLMWPEGWEVNTAVGREWETSSTIIPNIRVNSCFTVSLQNCIVFNYYTL